MSKPILRDLRTSGAGPLAALPPAADRPASVPFRSLNGEGLTHQAGASSQAVARALAAWADGLTAGSPRTAAAYQREARAFLAFLAGIHGPGLEVLLLAKPSDVRAHVLGVPGLGDASRALRAAVLRSMFGVLVVEGLMLSNPAAEVKVRRVKDARHHPATEYARIVAVLQGLAASEDPRDVRDRAMLLVLLNVAARRAEVASMTVGSLERLPDGRAWVSFTGKGRKAARMALHASTMRAVDRWLEVGRHGADPAAPLFHCLSHRPEHRGRALTGAGVAVIVRDRLECSPHCLRARAITDVWQRSGQNIHAAQAYARHSSPAITQAVYVQPAEAAWAQGHAPDFGAM